MTVPSGDSSSLESTDRPDAAMRLSLAAPVFAAAGHPGLRTPSLRDASWDVVRDAVMAAEALGYESVWFSDHLFHGRAGAFFESWTAMSMAAGFTERIRLVNNHLGNGLRDARVLGKMATTLAAATNGRFELFLAAGYREREYRAYGLEWDEDAVRGARLAEAIEVVRMLWGGAPVTFDGAHYSLDGAIAQPTTPELPFVWVGGPLDPQALETIATSADGWNSFPLNLGDYAAAAARVDEACRAAGRAPHTLRRSLETQVLVIDDEADWDEWLGRWAELREVAPLDDATADMLRADVPYERTTTDAMRETFIIGTEAQVRARIDAYRRLGVTDLVCWFMDLPDQHTMRRLAELFELAGAAHSHRSAPAAGRSTHNEINEERS